MAESVRETQVVPSTRVDNPPPDRTNIKTILTMLVLIVLVVIFWEGAKSFSKARGYELAFGETVIDLSIFNDTKLPHLPAIFEAFFQPAQRNGPPLYQTLFNYSLFTLGEALLGFGIGGILGFLLAVLFAHSSLMQRGVLPYVIASQTIPILAIAPMVVIWMRNIGQAGLAVPIIAAYLTFFPVTIYTLRGLTSVPQTSLELMQSYAATRRQILWKLRLPNALPHIFTALKISATSSIVGAIIGELPSGIQNGLGIALLNFTQFYNQSPPRLWAAIFTSALIGIMLFGVMALLERLIVRWQVKETN
ncbi:MAG: ABC transporter permease [Chloroflexi bacterium]|nr:ABC transporter permease [Chloroflexota bacterium]MCC6896057.1 ABC transporter permease [Anaerolineae bacterium]